MTAYQAIETYGAAVDRAVLAATRFGSPIEPATVASLSDMSTDELKKQLPGSLLHMGDGTFKFVPLERAVVVRQGVWSLSVKDHTGAPGVERSLDWIEAEVDSLAVGVIVFFPYD